MKICSKCGEEKPLTEFYKRKDSKDGHKNTRKICCDKLNRIYIKDDEFKKCWNINNLRLIPVIENSSKKDKIDVNLIKEHNIEYLLPGRIASRHL